MRANIMDYLFDRDYVISIYDDYVYFFNYQYLDSFDDKEIKVSLDGKVFTLNGKNLTIVKMTKEELLVKGIMSSLSVEIGK